MVSYLLGLLTLPILIGVLGVIYILVELLTARASRRRERYAAAEIEASSTT